MNESKEKTPEEINHHLSEERHKLEDSKLISRIEDLQAEIKNQLSIVQNEIRNIVSGKLHQDELNSSLLAELHQIAEMLQKLDSAHQYTHKIVSQHEKGLEENRQLIHHVEEELKKIKSLLRVD